MKKVLSALAISLLVVSYAAASPQQEKMKMCNKEAGDQGLKGSERKAFMKTCLSGKADEGGGKMAQQDRMKSCNKEAKEKSLMGDERKAFMKTCLSNK
ncbi:MAG: PsiF family protein [Pseudomonadota bacterium]